MSVTAPYDCFLESYLVRVEGAGRELQHALGAIKEVLDHFEPPPILEGRLKTPTSTYLKMLRDGLDFDEVHDLLGIRVILPHESLCVPVLESCQKRWPGRVHRVKDYINRPKPNGYQSLHACIDLPAGPTFEIQIRTLAMHRAAISGAAAHSRYKWLSNSRFANLPSQVFAQ